jgi:5-bromo-4-chloroindolyl phosphate hydrolysis protein
MSSQNGSYRGANKDHVFNSYVKITMQDQMAAEAAMAAKAKAMAEREELQDHIAEAKEAEALLRERLREREENISRSMRL